MEEVVSEAKFVSQKINKIRWQPLPRETIGHSSTFATGAWDDIENNVVIWNIKEGEAKDTSLNVRGQPQMTCEPQMISQITTKADITDLLFHNPEHLLAAASNGSVTLYKYDTRTQLLTVLSCWESLHRHPRQQCSCTSIATKGDDSFVSVGEDGTLNIVQMNQPKPSRTLEKADSCTLNAVCYLTQTEVGAVNQTGQLKVWDLRQKGDEPAKLLLQTGERVPLHCLDKHPTQPHIVATGGQDGALCIWDMRQEKFPVTLLSAHSADMWEVKFHPNHPDNVFTCSQDGSLWHWNNSGDSSNPVTLSSAAAAGRLASETSLSGTLVFPSQTSRVDTTNPWLGVDAAKHRALSVTDILAGNTMPVNSLDIHGTTLLCGTDGEKIYTVRNLVIR